MNEIENKERTPWREEISEVPMGLRLLALGNMLWHVRRKVRRVNWAINQAGKGPVELSPSGIRILQELVKSVYDAEVEVAKLDSGIQQILAQVRAIEDQVV
jgi:hypothetical protein